MTGDVDNVQFLTYFRNIVENLMEVYLELNEYGLVIFLSLVLPSDNYNAMRLKQEMTCHCLKY